jgi:hypothetical protein
VEETFVGDEAGEVEGFIDEGTPADEIDDGGEVENKEEAGGGTEDGVRTTTEMKGAGEGFVVDPTGEKDGGDGCETDRQESEKDGDDGIVMRQGEGQGQRTLEGDEEGEDDEEIRAHVIFLVRTATRRRGESLQNRERVGKEESKGIGGEEFRNGEKEICASRDVDLGGGGEGDGGEVFRAC